MRAGGHGSAFVCIVAFKSLKENGPFKVNHSEKTQLVQGGQEAPLYDIRCCFFVKFSAISYESPIFEVGLFLPRSCTVLDQS